MATLTPEEYARRVEKWASVGIHVAIVDAGLQALEQDRRESERRAPSKSGAMRKTIRVIRPTTRHVRRTGTVTLGLAAGSRVVLYASVVHTGKVGYPPGAKTKEHPIAAQGAGNEGYVTRFGRAGSRLRYISSRASGKKALSFMWGGKRVVVRSVNHPGSRFRARAFLKVDERRLRAVIKDGVIRSHGQEVG